MGNYIYTYACHKDEQELCALEMRSLFGCEFQSNIVESGVEIDPSRSPFIKGRVAVMYEGESLEYLLEQVATLQVTGQTFKVVYVPTDDTAKRLLKELGGRREIERKIGLKINGEPDLEHPERVFGFMLVNGRWIFGDYVKSEPIWLRHQKKPHSYSTALSTRVARAIVNIAIPTPSGVKAIDPCCGIGTVLVEALSMGIDIVGSDRNTFIIDRIIENIEYFGFTGEVKAADIREITEHYDVAMIDLPYNVCSVITSEEKREMLGSARKIAKKVVVVTVEPIDEILIDVGFSIVDRAVIKKASFRREVIVCE